MENQHRKITGYRELSQHEIDLMNAIKAKGAELLELQSELVEHLGAQKLAKERAMINHPPGSQAEEEAEAEYKRFFDAEPQRWAAIGKTDIQTGIMALVRAVAQPTGC